MTEKGEGRRQMGYIMRCNQVLTLKPPLAIPLSSDGSDRRFFKIQWKGKPAVAIEPSPGDIGISETYSYVAIGNHLARASVSAMRGRGNHCQEMALMLIVLLVLSNR